MLNRSWDQAFSGELTEALFQTQLLYGKLFWKQCKTSVGKIREEKKKLYLLLLKSDLCYYSYPLCCDESFFVIPLNPDHEQIPILHAFINRLRYIRVKRLPYDKMKIKKNK